MVLSATSLSQVAISGTIDAPVGDICQTGGLGSSSFSAVTISGTCEVLPVYVGICEDGGLSGFAFGSVVLSAICQLTPPIPPVPTPVTQDGHGRQWKPIQDRTTRLQQDDELIALFLAGFSATANQ